MLQTFFGYKTAATPKTNIQQITPGELQQRLQTGEALTLLDVRSPGEYIGEGHIPGARLLPLPNLRQRSNELPTDQPIVCICRSGNRSQVGPRHKTCPTFGKKILHTFERGIGYFPALCFGV